MADREYDNNRTGALFKNNDKQNEKHADYTGSCEIDGVHYFVDAYVRESKKDGRKFFALRFKPKNKQPDRGQGGYADPRQQQSQQRGGGQRAVPNSSWRDSDQDEIPF